MSTIISIIVFILVLGLVIFIHELGHFIFAKRANILCHEFSLGMGPILYSKRYGETLYAIRAIPIGGYVMMSGEEIDDEFIKSGDKIRVAFNDENVIEKLILDKDDEQYEQYELITVNTIDLRGINGEKLELNNYEVKRDAFYVMKNRELQVSPVDRGFNGKTRLERFLAIFAGPFMNFVLAFFVFLLVNLIVGFQTTDNTVVGTVQNDKPAGGIIQAGDEIISIEGEYVNNWYDVQQVLDKEPGKTLISIDVMRDGEVITLPLINPNIHFFSAGFNSSDSPDALTSLVIGGINETIQAGLGSTLENGDIILKVSDYSYFDNDREYKSVTTWHELVYYVSYNARQNNPRDVKDQEKVPLEFIVLRDGQEVTAKVERPYSENLLASQGLSVVDNEIGIAPEYEFNLGKSFVGGFQDIGASATMIFTTLDLLFNSYEVSVSNLAGPVGIFSITSSALKEGVISLMVWVGLLSVNLGVINLLPIPALDGGRLVFLGYETITTKKPNKKVENTLHYVMYMLLMGLFLFITYNDILRLFNIK